MINMAMQIQNSLEHLGVWNLKRHTHSINWITMSIPDITSFSRRNHPTFKLTLSLLLQVKNRLSLEVEVKYDWHGRYMEESHQNQTTLDLVILPWIWWWLLMLNMDGVNAYVRKLKSIFMRQMWMLAHIRIASSWEYSIYLILTRKYTLY